MTDDLKIEQLKVKDKLDLQYAYMILTTCKKGRIINTGYSCLHCGSTDPKEECFGQSYNELI